MDNNHKTRTIALAAALSPLLSATMSAKWAVVNQPVRTASLQIYIKMNTGEEGIIKQIMMVVGACIFLISAAIVLPAMFGYRI